MRKVLFIAILALAVMTMFGEDNAIIVPDFTLPDFEGNMVTLSDLEGLIILDFWATWCPPCRDEVPVLQNFIDEYSDRGLNIIGISSEDIATQQQFKEQMNEQGVAMSYTLLVDEDQSVFRQYEVQGIPTTIFVDSDLRQIYREVGFAPHYEEGFRKIIEENLPLAIE